MKRTELTGAPSPANLSLNFNKEFNKRQSVWSNSLAEQAKAGKVKIADIAHASDVSSSTVSMVLNDRPGISVETRRRVLDAANRLGYRRILRTGGASAARQANELHNLGLLVKVDAGDTPQANPFYSQVLAGIEDACRLQQINLLYAHIPVDEDSVPVEMPRLLAEDSVDGLLLVGAFVDATLDHLLGTRPRPVVLVDAYAEVDRYDAVVSENVGGAWRAVTYLLERGHRHIGLIGGRAGAYPSLRERRAGYLHALHDAGVSKAYMEDAAAGQADAATLSLLAQNPEITAIFACNDRAAIAAMRAAQSTGRRVPEDLSVVGFDDIDLAQHVVPALTTMHVDKVTMGRMAVQMLQHRLAYPDREQVTTLLRPRLVVRDSVVSRTKGAS
jgi:LacI family transcriptional regulator